MSLRQTLMTKPWEAGAGQAIERGAICNVASPWIALSAFIIMITVLFSLLTLGFFTRMASADWVPLIEPDLLGLNTILLGLSSITFHAAWLISRQPENTPLQDNRRNSLLLSGCLLSLGFIGGQIVSWRELYTQGNFIENNPAITFFFFITALHAVHLLGGLLAWGRTALKIRRGESGSEITKSLELCTGYWHYLLLLWMFMFALMVTDNNGKFDLIAICKGILLGE